MEIKQFYANITHDNGNIMIFVKATSREQAIKMICEAEGCPESAITAITD